MRLQLSLLLFTLLSAGAVFAAETNVAKPNVLFIVVEDVNWKTLGCYGNPIVKTPNLDKLAQSGVRFEHAYCQASACNASRTSFASGMRPGTTRVWYNRQRMCDEIPADIVMMPNLFKEAGYATINIGKFYHTTDYAPEQMKAFSRIESNQQPAGWQGPPPILKFPAARPDLNKKAKTQITRELITDGDRKRANSDNYGDSGFDQEGEGDWRRAKIACALMEEHAKSKEPFFMIIHQAKPHTPFLSPTKFVSMYDPKKIPDPPAPVASLKNFPYMARTQFNPDIFTESTATPQKAKEAIAAYYGCMTFVDDNIGIMLDTLEKTGLEKNTIVVCIGDHGVHLGDHNMWSKYSMLEGTQRAPMIVRIPGAKENGKVCQEIVEFVDILPTLIELCDLRRPDKLEGISFIPLLKENIAQPWKSAAFLVDQDYGHVVRTKKYAYMEFGDPKKNGGYKSALFDLEKDPHETVNVVDDSRYADTQRGLTQLLQKGWTAALPPDRP